MRLFVWRDPFDRFVPCLVSVPREKFDTDLRVRIQGLLQATYRNTTVEFTPRLLESMLARIHITVRTQPGNVPEMDVAELENRIVQTARHWQDDLAGALLERGGKEHGNHLLRRYANAFPVGFREDYAAHLAVRDVELMEPLLAANAADNLLTMQLCRPFEASPGVLCFRTCRAGQLASLSRSPPMLEHLGVRVNEKRLCYIEPTDAAPIWMHNFGAKTIDGSEVDLDEARARFEDVFARIWSGELENDDLSHLVLQTSLTWREVRILRAYVRYIRQIGSTFNDAYMEDALNGNSSIARALVRLFLARFNPTLAEAERSRASETLCKQIDEVLEDVPSLDEDRILRRFLSMLEATLRADYSQSPPNMAHNHGKGQPKPYLSFKFDPTRVPGLPEPGPIFEI